MDSLFPLPGPAVPGGFRYFDDFISEAEEKNLIEAISDIPLKPLMFQGFQARRLVASFGYNWSFTDRKLTAGQQIPEQFRDLIIQTAQVISLDPDKFAEMLITEYPPGAVINWHRDAPPFGIIAGISLKSDCLFRFRPYNRPPRNRSSVITLPLKRRSLYILSGSSRSEWEHSIPAVESSRLSITLRTLK